MPTNVTSLYDYLKSDLSQEHVKSYSVKKLCESAGICRATFYNYFPKGINEFYQRAFERECRQFLIYQSDSVSLERRLLNFLKQIRAERVYYENLYRLSDEKSRDDFIAKTVSLYIYRYYQSIQGETVSQRLVELSAGAIVFRSVSWIKNGFVHDIENLHRDAIFILRIIQRQMKVVTPRKESL